jgi:hypothetical protein
MAISTVYEEFKMLKHKLKWLILSILVYVGVSIYEEWNKNTLPDNIKKSVAQSFENIIEHRKNLQFEEMLYQQNKMDKSLNKYLAYENNDKWLENFSFSKERILFAQNRYDNQIKVLVDLNNIEDVDSIQYAVYENNFLLNKIKLQYKRPNERIYFLKKLDYEKYDTLRVLSNRLNKLDKKIDSLKQMCQLEQFLLFKTKNEVQRILDKIEQEQQYMGELIKKAHYLIKNESEYILKLEEIMGLFKDSFLKQTSVVNQLKRALYALEKSELNVLVDMKTSYFITIERESWSEKKDVPIIKYHIFEPIEVTKKDYIEFVKRDSKRAANIYNYDDFQIDMWSDSAWKSLKINHGDNLPSKHDGADFWIQNFQEKYYHKYLSEKNGKHYVSTWKEVSGEVFDTHIPNLGMELTRKVFGELTIQDENQFVSPLGFSFANNQYYGSWLKEDIWQFNQKYQFLNAYQTYPITKDEYMMWYEKYRKEKDYYGIDRSVGTFSAGILNNTKYKESNFYQTYVVKEDNKNYRYLDVFGEGVRVNNPKNQDTF